MQNHSDLDSGECGGVHVPKVLELIRTAAADCAEFGDNMARNELLDAADMTNGLLEAARKALIALRQVPSMTSEQLIADTELCKAICRAKGGAA